MVVEIVGPVFKCAHDERIFFSRLTEISGYESVLGKGSILHLTATGSSAELVASELQKVCDIWNTTFEVVSK